MLGLGAGIGGGSSTNYAGGSATVKISGGYVNSNGIGGGTSTIAAGGSADVTITGGTISATTIGGGFSNTYGYADGTVTVFGYDANGKKVELKTLNSNDIITMDNIDLSKTTTTTDKNGYTTVAYKDNNGNVVYSERLNPKGELLDKTYNFYNKTGNQVDNTKIVIIFIINVIFIVIWRLLKFIRNQLTLI
jgi:hypothetical protein